MKHEQNQTGKAIKTILVKMEATDARPAALEYAKGENQEIGRRLEDTIDIRAALAAYRPEKLSGAILTVGGIDFACPAFRALTLERIHHVYLYILTVGSLDGLSVKGSLSIADQLAADVWANGYLEAGRRLLRKHIRSSLEDSGTTCTIAGTYGPGYRGMALDSMVNFGKLVDGEVIGVTMNEAGVLSPAKTTAGMYIALTGSQEELNLESQDECVHCKGNRDSCAVCVNNKRTVGLALDIGTTTIAASLWERHGKKMLDSLSRTNPQVRLGPDVISRMEYAMLGDDQLKELRRLVVNCTGDMIMTMAQRCDINPADIDRVIIVGNPAMNHLFQGEKIDSLAHAPFHPKLIGPVTMTGRSAGLPVYPGGAVRLLPNLGGQVGSDALAVMLAAGMTPGSPAISKVRLAVDIGTNTEIILAGRGRLLVCSAAAGPAFEGGAIHNGMRALTGAISEVRIKPGEAGQPDDIKLTVIGKTAPAGICGSGLISAAAELLRNGYLIENGLLLEGDYCLYQKNERRLSIHQADIRQLQLAKAAVAAGIFILLKETGATIEDIIEINLTGAFGATVDPADAIAIGLLPDVPVQAIGHAAGIGASMALLSDQHWQDALQLADETEHIELADRPDFQDLFISSTGFSKQGSTEDFADLQQPE